MLAYDWSERDWVSVGFDIIGMAVPGAPSASPAYKAGKALDKAGDIAKAANKVDNFKSFTSRNFRKNLSKLTGSIPENAQAHHVLPQKFETFFSKVGINIHDPKFGAWWEKSDHLKSSSKYNKEWETFIESGEKTADKVLDFAREIADDYGLDTNF